MAKIECPNCGEKNDGLGKYCYNCGHALPQDAQPAVVPTTGPADTSHTTANSAQYPNPYPYPYPRQKNKTLKIVLLVISAMIVVWGGGYVFFRFFFVKVVARQTKIELLKKINSQCPVMADKLTRLDSVRIVGDNALEYFYTLSVDGASVDKNLVISNITPMLTEGVKNSAELALFRKLENTFIYTYRDTKGVVLFSIPIRPDMYR
jgi:hypothetical protein